GRWLTCFEVKAVEVGGAVVDVDEAGMAAVEEVEIEVTVSGVDPGAGRAEVGATAVEEAEEVVGHIVERSVQTCPMCGLSFHCSLAKTQHMQTHEERRQYPGYTES
ncbi:unnamed protein product, partial [Allacma fusca]